MGIKPRCSAADRPRHALEFLPDCPAPIFSFSDSGGVKASSRTFGVWKNFWHAETAHRLLGNWILKAFTCQTEHRRTGWGLLGPSAGKTMLRWMPV